jgi:hypothetical protein
MAAMGELAVLVYQSVDGGAFYLIAIGLYVKAHVAGEKMPDPNRRPVGKGEV